MKLFVNRKQTYHGFPQNKFEYKLHVKVEFSDTESKLLDKYKGWQEGIRVLTDNNNVKGNWTVNPKNLSERGAEWSSDAIYLLLSEMPETIAKALKTTFGEYHVREE